MRLMNLASGSTGNSSYVGEGNTHVLIDCGISLKRIKEGLDRINVGLGDLDAVFISHEHTDHISSLGALIRKTGLTVYGTAGTLEELSKTGNIPSEGFKEIKYDVPFELGRLLIDPIRISHDAAEPAAYRFAAVSFNDGVSVAVMTDLGYYDAYIEEKLEAVSAMLIESNHDIRMLEAGPYPYPLKQRILGKKGHLCNDHAGELLRGLKGNKLKKVFLGHLSQENNYPELAYETVRMALTLGDHLPRKSHVELEVARPDSASSLLEIEA